MRRNMSHLLMSHQPGQPLPTRFGFLLVNDFTLISMSSAVEPHGESHREEGCLQVEKRFPTTVDPSRE